MKGAVHREHRPTPLEPTTTDPAETMLERLEKAMRDRLADASSHSTAVEPVPPPVEEPPIATDEPPFVREPPAALEEPPLVREPPAALEEPPPASKPPTTLEGPHIAEGRPRRNIKPPERYGHNICAPLHSTEALTNVADVTNIVGQAEIATKYLSDRSIEAYKADFPLLGSCHPCPKSRGRHFEASLEDRDKRQQTYEEIGGENIEELLRQAEEIIKNNKQEINQPNSQIQSHSIEEAFPATTTEGGHDLHSAISTPATAEEASVPLLLQQLQTLLTMTKEAEQFSKNKEDEERSPTAENMREEDLLDLNEELDYDLESLLDNDTPLVAESMMEIDTVEATGMQIERIEKESAVFIKPIVRVASKEDFLKNISVVKVEKINLSVGTEEPGETVYYNSVLPGHSGTIDTSSTSSALLTTNVPATQACTESALGPAESPKTPLTSSQALPVATISSGKELARHCDTSVSFVGEKAPDTDLESPKTSRRLQTSYQIPKKKTWVTADTMLQVKRAVVAKGDEFVCTICQWTGTYKRARIHTKQHFVRYACACGILRVSRDAVYDHQISKRREAGHGDVPGEITEVDELSFPDFVARPEWNGQLTYPQLPPTTTGATQRQKKATPYNRSAKSSRQNSSKGKAPATNVPATTPLRVAPVRTPSPTRKPADLSTKLTNRKSPTRMYRADRDRRAAELVNEATRLDSMALDLYRRSRRHAPQSEEHMSLRQQARSAEREAEHYRRTAAYMRGQDS
jgi:hypothetical protein